MHTLTTLVGMRIFCYSGIFEYKRLSLVALTPLAGAYVGYVVLNNLNLQINTVSTQHLHHTRAPVLQGGS